MSHWSLAAHRAIECDRPVPIRRGGRVGGSALLRTLRTVSAVSRTRQGPSLSSWRTARSYASATRLSLARRTRVERVESKIRLSLGRGASELEAELARRGRQDPPSLPTAADPFSVSSSSSSTSSVKSTSLARCVRFGARENDRGQDRQRGRGAKGDVDDDPLMTMALVPPADDVLSASRESHGETRVLHRAPFHLHDF